MPQPGAESIFQVAREKTDPEARKAYLEGACGNDVALRAKVEELLRADDEAVTFAEEIAPRDIDATVRTPGREERGQEIGRYKLLQQIGEGGFGSVWMAEQREPVKRRVALKIIKLGMDTQQVIARFEAERQALAMMEHRQHRQGARRRHHRDGTSLLHHGARASGVPIPAYCDSKKLDTRERGWICL